MSRRGRHGGMGDGRRPRPASLAAARRLIATFRISGGAAAGLHAAVWRSGGDFHSVAGLPGRRWLSRYPWRDGPHVRPGTMTAVGLARRHPSHGSFCLRYRKDSNTEEGRRATEGHRSRNGWVARGSTTPLSVGPRAMTNRCDSCALRGPPFFLRVEKTFVLTLQYVGCRRRRGGAPGPTLGVRPDAGTQEISTADVRRCRVPLPRFRSTSQNGAGFRLTVPLGPSACIRAHPRLKSLAARHRHAPRKPTLVLAGA